MDADELAFLRTVPCFGELPTADLVQVRRSMRGRKLRAGEIIVRTGERTATLYVVRRGRVRLFVTTVGGTERVLTVLGAGATFNEAAACDGGPAAATAQSLSSETCIDEVPAALVCHLVARHPPLVAHLARAMARHIRRLAALVDDRSRVGSAH